MELNTRRTVMFEQCTSQESDTVNQAAAGEMTKKMGWNNFLSKIQRYIIKGNLSAQANEKYNFHKSL